MITECDNKVKGDMITNCDMLPDDHRLSRVASADKSRESLTIVTKTE